MREGRRAIAPARALQFKKHRLNSRSANAGHPSDRSIKTQTVLPSAETAAMLFWALLASGQITLRKVDGWQTLDGHLAQPIDLAA
jgi:putative transposase